MIKLNKYINEAWSGVKKQASIDVEAIEKWYEEIGIKKYTINSKGEIDVNENVWLGSKRIKELPYKFGTVTEYFDISGCKNLISLKNCPNEVRGYFDVDGCTKLDSLEGCPKEVEEYFFCRNCKRKFTKEEVQSLCNVKKTNIYV